MVVYSLAIIRVKGLLSAIASRHKADIGYRGKLKAPNKTSRERTVFLSFSNFALNQIVSINLVVKKAGQVAMFKPLLRHSAKPSFFFFLIYCFLDRKLGFFNQSVKLNSTQLYSTSLPGSLNQLEDLMTRGIKSQAQY